MKIAFDRNFIHSTFRGNNKDIQSLNFPYTSLHRQTDRDIFLKVSNSYSSNIVPDIEIPEDYDKEEFMKMLLSYEIRKLSENGNVDKRIDRDVTLRYLFQKLHKNNYTDFLVETFEKNDMGTVGDFRNFVSHVTKLDKQFDQCIYNFIEIFPSLNDKKDMENFPEILLTSKLASNYYKDPTIINKNVEFVKKMGYTNENKFYAAYYPIYADSFNCFTTPLDRYYLLEHVVETYDERFKVFKLITDPSSKKKDK